MDPNTPTLSPSPIPQPEGEVWKIIVVILVLIGMLVSLFNEWGPAHIVMITALVIVWDCGIVNTTEALSGFSNPSMIMVGCLFIVAQGVEKSHLIEKLALRVFGEDTTKFSASVRLMCMTFFCSAIFNNTPLVFILIPITRDWARMRGFAPSEFLIPLSFSSILGGCLTTIGTSTNLVINGLLEDAGREPFGFIEPAYLGLPIGVLAIVYLAVMGPLLLPNDKGGLFREMRDNAEELITELKITEKCPFVAKPIDAVLDKLGITHNKLIKIRRRCTRESEGEDIIDGGTSIRRNLLEDKSSPIQENPVPTIIPPPKSSPKLSSSKQKQSQSPAQKCRTKKMDPDRCDETYFHSKRHLWDIPSPDVTPLSSDADLVNLVMMEAAQREHNYNPTYATSFKSASGSSGSIGSSGLHGLSGSIEYNSNDSEDISTINEVPIDIELAGGAEGEDRDLGTIRGSVCGNSSFKGRSVDIFPVPEGVTVVKGDILFVLTSADMITTAINDREVMQGVSILDTNIFNLPGFGTELVELCVSRRNPFVGKTISSSDFGKHYGGSVVATRHMSAQTPAIHSRSGQSPLPNVLGRDKRERETLQPGDLVMLLVNEQAWEELQRGLQRSDFFAVSLVGQLPAQVSWWDYGGVVVFFAMLVALIFVDYFPFTGVQVTFSAMILIMAGGWIAPKDALAAVDFPLLALIGAALGFARAVTTSGLARAIADFVANQALPPIGAMFLVALLTMVLTNVVTNNAAAALVVPIALSIADSLEVDYRPFIMAVLYAASIAFMTPIGYQTNTMVWGPGGYSFLDFMKIGIPLNVLYVCIACVLLPLVFPF